MASEAAKRGHSVNLSIDQKFEGQRKASNAKAEGYWYSGRLNHQQVHQLGAISRALGDLFVRATTRLSLSTRACQRRLKAYHPIADLAGTSHIAATHLLEAIHYRSLNRAGGS